MFTAILTFLALPYIFWTIFGLMILWGHKGLFDDDDFNGWRLFVVGIIGTLVLWRFPDARTFMLTWKGGFMVLGGYILAGGFMALYKWVQTLSDFRVRAKEWLEKNKDYHDEREDKANALSDFLYGGYSYRVNEIPASGDGVQTKVHSSYYLNWRKFPISNWWVYWPFFLFSVIFDPIERLIKHAIEFLANLWERLAKHFSVS